MPEDRSVLTRPAPEPDGELRYGPEPEHVADLWRGRPDGPLIVVLHGGFWRPAVDRRHTRPMAAALRDAGASVLSVEYRRVPGEPALATHDVATALRVLPVELAGQHDGSIIVTGHSAGGHLALWAAAAAPAPDLTATVALAPVADLALADELGLGDGAARAFLGGRPRPDLDPVRLPSPSRPVVLVHGTADDVVPIKLSRAYAEVHPDARLVAVPDAGHFAMIDPIGGTWPAVKSSLVTRAQNVAEPRRKRSGPS
ncbi:alpha/beta hydrolase [Amycolatopsis endophytica]|uniref:Acetyl esterase/lipase n=1 Tax=Amycolatopsis endophytica TaxID=860233 RepID=A0A853AX80_9PSEU|nr:alpha/beta hydrolase [Amycolatopsis endophytica]NYI87235.1 acetyl esterase/lipase [Amycolatopsis endophytica]